MRQNWPTREQDLFAARLIMEDYAKEYDAEVVGLLEIVVDSSEKRMDFRLSRWVMVLAKYFVSQYGTNQGDYITRQVISQYIIQEQTIH